MEANINVIISESCIYSINYQLTRQKINLIFHQLKNLKECTLALIQQVDCICRIMQWRVIPAKWKYDAIITITNILWKINYQKLHHLLDPYRLQNTNYQIAIVSSTSVIVVRIISFTVVLCVHNSVLSFLHKLIAHKPVFAPLSNKG